MLKKKKYGKFLFIHINKCGGTSIEKALGIPIKIHETALQLRKRLGDEPWSRMFKFALVRNPYDKVCSHYRYRVKTGQTGLKFMRLSLNDWVYEAYGEKNPIYYDNELMFKPCFDWLVDENGGILIDEVYKLESINDSWPYIMNRCGVNATLPKANQTSVSDGSGRNDLNCTSVEIINKLFKSDFTNSE